MIRRSATLLVLSGIVFVCSIVAGKSTPEEFDLRGAWQCESYLLKDGTKHAVQGRIFFTSKEWTVLFFVTTEGLPPQRGSAEGGAYTLTGDRLIFTHRYNLSAGKAVAGLPESPLRMTINDASETPTEPCVIKIDGERLTIHFPSGNSMTFRRSSTF